MSRITRTEARMIAEELHALMRNDLRTTAQAIAVEQSEELLTAKQAAAFLGCSLRKLYDIREELPHTRLPGSRLIRFPKSGLVRRLNENRP